MKHKSIIGKVTEISSFTTPSCQVKPRVKIKLVGTDTYKSISFNNFAMLGHKHVDIGTVIYFKGVVAPRGIDRVDNRNSIYSPTATIPRYIPLTCPACGSGHLINFGKELYCPNDYCFASNIGRFKRLIKNIPIISAYYDTDAILTLLRKKVKIDFISIIDSREMPRFSHFLKFDLEKVNINGLMENYRNHIKLHTSSMDIMLALDMRVGDVIAHKVTMGGTIPFPVVATYNAGDYVSYGVNPEEARKIIRMSKITYNKRIIDLFITLLENK